jgi:hypothetical protein
MMDESNPWYSKHLGQIWSDERWMQHRMIQERLKAGMPRAEVQRIAREHEQIAQEYEYVRAA